jgi:hypothetical protein
VETRPKQYTAPSLVYWTQTFKLIKKKYQPTQLGKVLKHLNELMKEKRKDFPQEQRINQLSAAEFGETKVRHKFGTGCRIMRR